MWAVPSWSIAQLLRAVADSPSCFILLACFACVQEIASALAYLHAHNVWHGDLAGRQAASSVCVGDG